MSPLTTTSILSPRSLRKRSLPTLPSELILHIFKFLTTPHDLRVAILVCKLWCTCGMDLLWSRPALLSSSVVEQITQTLSLEPSEMTFPYRDHVRRLNFSLVARDLVDEELVRFACCTRLERLILQGCTQITPDALLRILMAGQALVSLDLSEITTVGDSVIEQVATYCTKLHTLYIASCNAVTDSSISKLAQSCPSLKRV
ncbi:SCF ubiquitin ligase complex subunit, partial [Lunasporangiospora selenospora]